MRRALPRFLRFGFVLPLLLPAIAGAQYADPTENHPGFWVEWLAHADSTINGVALGDADQDGDPDLFVVDGSSLELWRNNGRGEFTPDLGALSPLPLIDLISLDFDGDAQADIAGTVAGGGIALFRNAGGGMFAAPVISASGTAYEHLAEIDVNGDGHRDLVATLAPPARGIDLFMRTGASFAIATRLLSDFEVASVTPADLNGDGRMDLIAGTWWFGESVQIQMLLNGSNGLEVGAIVPIGTVAYGSHAFDFDSDGDMDVLYLAGDYYAALLLGDGSGRQWDAPTFAEGFAGYGQSAAPADLDRDGRSELYVVWRDSGGAVLGRFDPSSDPEQSSPRLMSYAHSYGYSYSSGPDRIFSADVNGDGWPDLLTTDTSSGLFGVILNRRGFPGAMLFAPLDRTAGPIVAARLNPSQPPQLVFGSTEGLFVTALRDDGTLTPSHRIGDGYSARAVDLNRDGRDDLIVKLADGSTEIRLAADVGFHPASIQFEGTVVDFGTVDPDPWIDLLVHDADGSLDIHWGDPKTRFKRVTPTGLSKERLDGVRSTPVNLCDADGDGCAELVECRLGVPRYYSGSDSLVDTILVHRVFPSGRIRDSRLSTMPGSMYPDSWPRMVRTGNLDGIPGDEIVLLTGPSGGNASQFHVFRSKGNGQYESGGSWPAGGEDPSGLTLADFDGDGDLDVACTANREGYLGILHVRWNDGNGNLLGRWARRVALNVAGLSSADFDGDDIPDLATLAGYGSDRRVAFLFGRRDAVATHVSQLDFAEASAPEKAHGIAILGIGPNPARGAFMIRWRAQPGAPATIELHDVTGRRLKTVDLHDPGDDETVTRFETQDNLPAGLYWVRLRQGNQTVTKRVALIR